MQYREVVCAFESLVALTHVPIQSHFPEGCFVNGYGTVLWSVPSSLSSFSKYVLDHRICLAPMRWKVRQWPYWVGYHPEGLDWLRRRARPRGAAPRGKIWYEDQFVLKSPAL